MSDDTRSGTGLFDMLIARQVTAPVSDATIRAVIVHGNSDTDVEFAADTLGLALEAALLAAPAPEVSDV